MIDEKKSGEGKLEFWAILELFGHTKIAGYVREVALGGDAMLRVDVPELRFTELLSRYEIKEGCSPTRVVELAAFTKFYSPKAVFAMTPATEEACRAIMQNLRVRPVNTFDLPRALPAPTLTSADDKDDFDIAGRDGDDVEDRDEDDPIYSDDVSR